MSAATPARRPAIRDLSKPLIHVGNEDGIGFTLLTGGNVALAPAFVANVANGGPWEQVERLYPGLAFLAFARPRKHGLAGVSGSVERNEDGDTVMRLGQTFGSPGALTCLGECLGRYLADRRRFPEGPTVIHAEDTPARADALHAALASQGVAVGPAPDACGRDHRP